MKKSNPSRLRHGNCRKGKITAEYRIWRHLRTRCENKRCPAFDDYGGRGIKVCERWLDFANFLADMGPRPSEKHSLDRYPDQNGDYEPSNCRWATSKEQNRNRRDNSIFTFNGVTATLAELCEINGCKYKTVHARIQKGASIEIAMSPNSLPMGPGNSIQRLLIDQPRTTKC